MPSRKDKSPAAFNDVKFVLDLAVNKPGLKYVMKGEGPAVNFKQRCNKFRNLMREMAAEQIRNIPGMRAETVYDHLVIRQVNEAGDPDRHGHIVRFDHQEIQGTLIDPETGQPIEIPGITDTIVEK